MKNKVINKLKNIVSENFKFWEVIILMGLTAIVGVSVGGFIIKNNYGLNFNGQLSPKLQEFISNYNYISKNYYGDFDEEKLLNKALQSILEEIDDPYAAYMDENTSNNFNIKLAGSYQGLGIEVANLISTSELIITQVFSDSPASLAGLKDGDILLKINGENVTGLKSSEFSSKLKEIGGSFVLKIKRDTKELDFELSLGKVVFKSINSKMFDNKIGYICVSIFADNTFEQMHQALDLLKKDGMKHLIIDVRNNTGGYLSSVEKILGLFLDSSHVIYQIEDKNKTTKYYSGGNETANYDIIILTNEITASASEILTAALKEELKAVSIGNKTYGKGSAQKLHTLSDGSNYKFTTQRWLTPSGLSIEGKGIEVDYSVDLPDTYYQNLTFEDDSQLQFAINLLLKS